MYSASARCSSERAFTGTGAYGVAVTVGGEVRDSRMASTNWEFWLSKLKASCPLPTSGAADPYVLLVALAASLGAHITLSLSHYLLLVWHIQSEQGDLSRSRRKNAMQCKHAAWIKSEVILKFLCTWGKLSKVVEIVPSDGLGWRGREVHVRWQHIIRPLEMTIETC